MTQRLELFQSLWSMERRRPDGEEWSLEEQFKMIAEAGFDGAAMDHEADEIPTVTRARQLYGDHGLACSITAFPQTIDDLKQVLDSAVALDARMVVVNAKILPFTPREGAELVQQSLELSRQVKMPVYFETHRLTLTTDMLFTLQLLELVPELEVIADLSHFVVAREFPWPVDQQHEDWIDQILQRSAGFQGRIATREQVQVPIEFPQHQGWVNQFYGWWEKGFKYWRARVAEDAALNFLCELGPPPYAITGADGYELSNRWSEAFVMKDRVRAMWGTLEASN